MMQDIKSEMVVNDYLNLIKSTFDSAHFKGSGVIKTPYKKPNGDFIEVRIYKNKNKIYLTDDGGTYNYLFLSGLDLQSDSSNRENIISRVLTSNMVSFINDVELGVEINNADEIGNAMARLLRTINALHYLIYTVRPGGIHYFKESVASFFDYNDIDYKLDYTIQGKAKTHKFDFYIARKNLYVIKTLSTENLPWARRLAKETMFDFVDTKAHSPEFKGVALIDDSHPNIWEGDAIKILESYSDHVIGWKGRNDLLDLLVS